MKKVAGWLVLPAMVMMLQSPATEAGTLYRWKDSEGQMVVSDRPPPAGVSYETVTTTSSMVVNTADPVQIPEPEEPPAATPKPAEKAGKKAAAGTVYKKNPEYCAGARQNMQTLERPRIRIIGEDGEARFLSEEERAAERAKAQEVIDLHCE